MSCSRYIHHIATIALVAGSWIHGFLRIGVLVLYMHDVSDIPLDLMKMFNYLKLQVCSLVALQLPGYTRVRGYCALCCTEWRWHVCIVVYR